MRLDPRVVLPAARAAAAIAIPAGTAGADKPATGACPDDFMGPFPIGFITDKDKNGNDQVCVKESDMKLVFKDDTCNPNCDKEDLSPIAPLLQDSYADDVLPDVVGRAAADARRAAPRGRPFPRA
jgi:hypothetical protein